MPLGAETLVIASHNPGKVREIAELVDPFGVTVTSAGELGLAEPAETGTTFAENAELKARASAKDAGLPALADDSGLAVSALGGRPGIYSARWAGPDKDFRAAMDRVERELREVNGGPGGDRSACFVCALTLAVPDGSVRTFQGQIDGTLVYPPRGERGFGYDPVFVPEGHAVTFGEMDPAQKHAMSHRARAFRQLVDAVFRA
jgi:XTP/dITP diphosphohydrolase